MENKLMIKVTEEGYSLINDNEIIFNTVDDHMSAYQLSKMLRELGHRVELTN